MVIVRYFYTWTPLVVVGTIVLLSLPWLGLIALLIVAIVAFIAVAALAWAIVFVPYTLTRAVRRRRRGRSIASPRTASAVSPAGSGSQRIRSERRRQWLPGH